MTKAYLNYPNAHMTLHGDPACGQIAKMKKDSQRVVTVDGKSFNQVLNQLSSRDFSLGATASVNDIWLSVDFENPEFEEAVARYLYKILGGRYSRLLGTPIRRHC